MPVLETYEGDYLWKYMPNLPVAIICTLVFLILTIGHIWKLIKYRTWFCFAFVVGGTCEILGYASRVWARGSTGSLAPFLLQAIFLLLAPCFFAGGLYMVYSRVVRAVHGEDFSLIPPRWCTIIFLSGDWLCLNIQSAGAGFLPKPNLENVGNGIIVSGLGLQVVIFAGFMYCCLRFQTRFRAHLIATGKVVLIPWETVLYMLYGTSIIISIRNIFRFVEFTAGHDSYLFTHEWPVYVFDGTLMILVMTGFYIWFPNLDSASADQMIQPMEERE